MIPNEIKVECEIGKEDIVVWNNYYIQNAPKSKRTLKNTAFYVTYNACHIDYRHCLYFWG